MILSLIAILAAGPAHALVETPVPVRLILIDSRTTFKLGPLPWPRDRHARMVDLLSQAGARAIALRFYYRDSRRDEGDRKLVEAVRKSGRVFIEFGKTADAPSWQPDAAWMKTMALKTSGAPPRGSDSLTSRIAATFLKSPALLSMQNAQLPFEELARAVRGVGSIDVIVDSEKKLKAIPLLVRYKDEIFPSLGMRLFLAVSGLDAEPLVFEGKEAMILAGRKIKLDKYGCILVNLSSPGSGYPVHSFLDVMEGKVSPKKFKDSVVIVGSSSPELDVETATGPKNGLELVADQFVTLLSFTGQTSR